ncbi:popeye domain-containing protein 3 [Oryzias melastigma]|uniref:Popeye domain cAMP effector 3 n=2 Tax=Oryzias melastigma TaxID=30732 RepID=A0A3B3CPR1_ORYME|nr:popeye domain-containing protein 3 [Oryzias melastigma]
MEPPDFGALNLTRELPPSGHPLCEAWGSRAEGPVFHLGHILLFLGFSGGSGSYGRLYSFSLLTLGFLCSSLESWSDPCSVESLLWNLALSCACLGQTVLVAFRLRSLSFSGDLRRLYDCVFRRLGVSLAHFGEIIACSDPDAHVLEKDHCFAVEGKTSIDKLSVLLAGRVRVSVKGEFLHYIYPFQFLDSPEWDSLRPSEEGLFQVTLHADETCHYVCWRRKKLYLLFAKHRYIARIFALVVRNDIAEKLYSLSDKAVNRSGHRYDLRLPTFCHKPAISVEDADEKRQGEMAA